MLNVINVLHVDDEEQSRLALRTITASMPELNHIESFANAENCYEYLEQHEGSFLLFLDIEPGGNNSLWLARQLADARVSIVFLTSYAEYAERAFEANALQFIIKPVTAVKMNMVLRKLKLQKAKLDSLLLEHLNDFYPPAEQPGIPKRIFVPTMAKLEVLGLDELLYVTARSNNYSEFVMKDGKRVLSSKTIKTYEDVLAQHSDFVRIHKSHIINKVWLRTISRKRRSIKVVMSDGEELDISYQRRAEIMELLTC